MNAALSSHPCHSRRLPDATCRAARADIYPATGPKITTFKSAYRRGIVLLRANRWHDSRSLGGALFCDDVKGLFRDEYATEAFATRLIAQNPRIPPKQESMADTIDFYLARPEKVPYSMREAFEKDRATAESYSTVELCRDFTDGTSPLGHQKAATEVRTSNRAGLLVLNAADWLGTTPVPVDMILTDAADMGTKIILIAQSKFRKSFFLLQLAIFLAHGKLRFLSWDVPKLRRVLFVNLEITPTHFHRRLARMLKSVGLSADDIGDRLHILNGRGQPAEVILKSLATLVSKHEIEVLIIDPVYKLIDGDESKQECVKGLLREFDGLCSETGCALLYVHHCGKGESGDRLAIDRASGSGVLARDFDTQISLTPHLDDGLIVVEQIARSYPPREPFCIEWDDSGFFKMRGDATPVIRTSFNRSKSGRVGKPLTDEDALDALGYKAMPGKAFIDAMRKRGFTARHAEATRDRMVENGVLETFSPPVFPRRIYYGTPGMIETLRQIGKKE